MVAPGLWLGAGETVGNSPAGLPRLVPLLVADGSVTGGSVPGGSVAVAGGGELVAGGGVAAVTTTDPDAVKECEPFPEAAAVSWTCSPLTAELCTAAVACSSSACPAGSVPIAQVAVPGLGQAVKCGASTCLALPIPMWTVTDLLSPGVLHTQIAKPAW